MVKRVGGPENIFISLVFLVINVFHRNPSAY